MDTKRRPTPQGPPIPPPPPLTPEAVERLDALAARMAEKETQKAETALDEAEREAGTRRQRTTSAPSVMRQGPERPDPYVCPECDTACAFAPHGDHGRLSPAAPRFWRRTECLCETRRREQEEARKADERAQAAAEALQRRIARNWERSRLAGRRGLLRYTFEAFDPDRSPEEAAAYEALAAWADAFSEESDRGWVLRSEGSGCGKTMLAVAAAQRVLGLGYSVWFGTVGELFGILRGGVRAGGDQLDRRIQELAGFDLLILDDVGTERMPADAEGDWRRQMLFEVLNERERRAAPVLATTKLTEEQLLLWLGGDRGVAESILSRLLGLARWLETDGPDGRPAAS